MQIHHLTATARKIIVTTTSTSFIDLLAVETGLSAAVVFNELKNGGVTSVTLQPDGGDISRTRDRDTAVLLPTEGLLIQDKARDTMDDLVGINMLLIAIGASPVTTRIEFGFIPNT